MDISVDKVRKTKKIAQQPISLETPLGEEEDSHLGDFLEDKTAVSPSDAAINLSLMEQTSSVLKTLTPREEKIIKMRFGLTEIGDAGRIHSKKWAKHSPSLASVSVRSKPRHSAS